MTTFLKWFIGVIFSLIFSVFIILYSLYFQLFNASFLFSTFQKYHVYEQIPNLATQSLPNDPNLSPEEKLGYSEVAKQLSPAVIQKITESSLVSILNYAHGTSDNIVINVEGMEWSANSTQFPQLAQLHGTSRNILLILITTSLVLIGLFAWYGKLSKTKFGGSTLLISTGLYTGLSSVVLAFGSLQIGKQLLTEPEPSQKIIGLLSSSLFYEIAKTWTVISVVLLILGLILKKLK